ncbi:hypothetical protein FQR65_LT19816 [Abscondita terminalis]|nr:hypothetical protein FQR65_LT19816 [Abscondita terminalis]
MFSVENEPGDKIQVTEVFPMLMKPTFVASQFCENSMRNQRKPVHLKMHENEKNIPYKVYGGLSFYQRKEIKDLIAYLRLLVNENDQEALLRIINYPTRGYR